MKKLNNKGQVLVLFAILLPILLIILLLGIEISNITRTKTETKNKIQEIIKENLNHYDEQTNSRVNILIEKNIKDIKEKEIFTSEDEIRIHIKQEKKLFGRKIELNYKYKGIKQDKIIISEG